MEAALAPSKYIGRSSQQVEKFLQEVKPYIEGIHAESASINV